LVRIWDLAINNAIATTKMRIKHMEKHGVGDTIIREKRTLEKQLRHKKLRDEKL